MTAKAIFGLFLLLATVFAQVGQAGPEATDQTSIRFLPPMLPCVAYEAADCILCPYNYHINQNQCFKNVTGCTRYVINSEGVEQCQECDPSLGRLDGRGGCSV